ncbi:MAG: hypothetical protein Q8O76_11340, partial [Chloroflexota bacterium]|nr:hypothetical protein [Chloroflexota bacterium]
MAVWRYICDDGASASFGLAGDEYLMGGYGEGQRPRPPTLRLYTYQSHCVLVGRFQTVEAEVSQMALCFGGRVPYSEAMRASFPQGGNHVSINRRPTGGGTIIMGEGQLGVAVVASARDY